MSESEIMRTMQCLCTFLFLFLYSWLASNVSGKCRSQNIAIYSPPWPSKTAKRAFPSPRSRMCKWASSWPRSVGEGSERWCAAQSWQARFAGAPGWTCQKNDDCFVHVVSVLSGYILHPAAWFQIYFGSVLGQVLIIPNDATQKQVFLIASECGCPPNRLGS